MLVLTVLSIFPLCFVLWYSLTDYYYLTPVAPKFIGLRNFQKILTDEYFLQALGNTLKFTVLAVLLEVAFGLAVAILINGIQKRQKLVRTTVMLPMLLPPVTVALVWQMMFSNNYGIINNVLAFFHIAPVNWLMDVRTAFYAILVIDIWQYTPFAFLLMYAALQSVPQGQYEAAAIDGANAWQKFTRVTVPNIFKNIVMVVLLRVIDTFRLFDKVNILTKGGPSNSTATITQYIYQYGVKMLKVGYGSAASVIMTIIVLFLAFGYIQQNFKKNNARKK